MKNLLGFKCCGGEGSEIELFWGGLNKIDLSNVNLDF
tara:strand:- start:294 stop:404 length:111 start_codon:yes stop_codon:yes gene_type:complete